MDPSDNVKEPVARPPTLGGELDNL